MLRHLTFSDRLVSHLDNALKTLTPDAVHAKQTLPGNHLPKQLNSEQDRKHIAGLMRINHTGEVCAQALYQGQALTARLPDIRATMDKAAEEELDHLAWCQQRLNELNDRTSYLNPAFYTLSYLLGAAAGLAGDKWSLGFVAATEQQVSQHLTDHIQQLRDLDPRSLAILEKMLADEAEHASNALAAGGVDFPNWLKAAMTQISKLMTTSAYKV